MAWRSVKAQGQLTFTLSYNLSGFKILLCKGKAVTVLFLTELHAMKAYWSGGIAPLIL
jgi:hypothetical protein